MIKMMMDNHAAKASLMILKMTKQRQRQRETEIVRENERSLNACLQYTHEDKSEITGISVEELK